MPAHDEPHDADARQQDQEDRARRGLQRIVAVLVDDLTAAIDEGATTADLRAIVAEWETENDLTYDSIVETGSPTTCEDCHDDLTPYDETGRPIPGKWQWYMVVDDIWNAATVDRPARFLCIDCLEQRLGRRLTASDFADVPVNRAEDRHPALLARLTA